MTREQISIAVVLHLLVPLLGVAGFIWLCRRMLKAAIPQPPYSSLFCLLGISGGWLLILLTALSWTWSGMASLGFLALILGSPWLTLGLGLGLRNRRRLSPYHRWTFLVSVSYSVLSFALALSGLVYWRIWSAAPR